MAFFSASQKTRGIPGVLSFKKAQNITGFVIVMINW